MRILHRLWLPGKKLASLESSRRPAAHLALINLCTRNPFGLGLLGDRPDHVFVEIDMLDLDMVT